VEKTPVEVIVGSEREVCKIYDLDPKQLEKEIDALTGSVDGVLDSLLDNQ
jgi:hypothetical protein